MPKIERSFRQKKNPYKISVRNIDWYSPNAKKGINKMRVHQNRHCKQLSVPRSRERLTREVLVKQAFGRMARSRLVDQELLDKAHNRKFKSFQKANSHEIKQAVSQNHFNVTKIS